MADRGANSGLYAISVVAQLVGTGQQNIRLYERRGLLAPDRTAGWHPAVQRRRPRGAAADRRTPGGGP